MVDMCHCLPESVKFACDILSWNSYALHDDPVCCDLITESGEKFIGLERNKNVSLAVFEKPPDFGALKSVLVMGTAKLIEPMLFEVPGFDEYSENLIKSSMIGVRKISFGKESVAETREIPYNNADYNMHICNRFVRKKMKNQNCVYFRNNFLL